MNTAIRGVGIEHYGGFYPPYEYDMGGGYKYETLGKAILAHEPKAWLAIATTNTAQKKVIPYLKKAGWKMVGTTSSSHGDGTKIFLHIYRNKDVAPPTETKVGEHAIGGCSQYMYVRKEPVYSPSDLAYNMKVQVITRELKLAEVKKMRTHKWRRIAKANDISVWTNAKKDD